MDDAEFIAPNAILASKSVAELILHIDKVGARRYCGDGLMPQESQAMPKKC